MARSKDKRQRRGGFDNKESAEVPPKGYKRPRIAGTPVKKKAKKK